jgi:hypothetical protein
MTIKASGRSVLILATGLLVFSAGPSLVAAAADDNGGAEPTAANSEADSAAAEPVAVKKHIRHAAHHAKRHVQPKPSDEAQDAPAPRKQGTTDLTADDQAISTAVPTSVANANAQLAAADSQTGTDTPGGNAQAMSMRANDRLQAAPDNPAAAQPAAEAPVVSPDALNDIDRTLPAGATPAPTVAMAPADQPAVTSHDRLTPDKTSLIGEIFMACGGILTLASAARMFMG